MNSFRFLERGLEAEIARQIEIVKSGGQVEQETLHFDPTSGSLTSLRSKEEAHDYRYFPEPDLVPLAPTEAMIERARDDAARAAVRARRALRTRHVAARPTPPRCWPSAASWATTSRPRWRRGGDVDAAQLASWVTVELVAAPGRRRAAGVEGRAGRARAARRHGRRQADLARRRQGSPRRPGRRGRRPRRDRRRARPGDAGRRRAVESIVDAALAANPKAVEQYKEGKGKAIGAIVGFVMRETKGRADGGEVNRLIREKIG